MKSGPRLVRPWPGRPDRFPRHCVPLAMQRKREHRHLLLFSKDHVRFVGLNANHMRTSDVTAVQMEGVAVAVFMPFRKDIVDDWAIVVEWPTLVTTTIIPDRWRMHW